MEMFSDDCKFLVKITSFSSTLQLCNFPQFKFWSWCAGFQASNEMTSVTVANSYKCRLNVHDVYNKWWEQNVKTNVHVTMRCLITQLEECHYICVVNLKCHITLLQITSPVEVRRSKGCPITSVSTFTWIRMPTTVARLPVDSASSIN